jgi:hypothetical protein
MGRTIANLSLSRCTPVANERLHMKVKLIWSAQVLLCSLGVLVFHGMALEHICDFEWCIQCYNNTRCIWTTSTCCLGFISHRICPLMGCTSITSCLLHMPTCNLHYLRTVFMFVWVSGAAYILRKGDIEHVLSVVLAPSDRSAARSFRWGGRGLTVRLYAIYVWF